MDDINKKNKLQYSTFELQCHDYNHDKTPVFTGGGLFFSEFLVIFFGTL